MALAPFYVGIRKGCLSVVLAMIGVSFISLLYPAHGQEMAAVKEAESSRNSQAEADEPEKAASRGKPAMLTAMQALPESVELTFSAPVKFHSERLPGNAGQAGRFYIDAFPASLVPQRGSTVKIAAGPVQRVRSSLFRPGVVRVVLDLREERNFQVATLTDPDRLVITVQQKGGATNPAQPAPHTTETKQTSATPDKDVAKKRVQPYEFPDVQWQLMTQPWTLMLHSHAAAVDLVFSSPSPVAAIDAVKQTGSDAVELTSLKQVDEFSKQLLVAQDFSPSDKQSLLLAPLWSATETAPLALEKFSTGWAWGGACRNGDCVRLAGRDDNGMAINAVREQPKEAKTIDIDMEAQQLVANAFEQPRQKAIRTGGALMGELWMAAMTAGVFLSFLAGVGVVVLWNLRKRGASTEKSDGWEGRMAYLEEAVNRAGMLNNSFFHSLEVSQKRLETLLTQADVTEQNLRRLLHQAAFTGERSTGRSPDALTTAALLLSEGEGVQQVARVLKLPVAQVRLLQEIRQYTQGEKPAENPEKVTAPSSLASVTSSLNNLATRLNGAARNGMHLAQSSEQSL